PNIARLGPFTRAISLVTLGSLAGTVLGVAQWLVLRSQAPRIRHWVATTAIGLAISFSAASMLLTAAGLRISSGLGAGAFVGISGLLFGAITSRPWQRVAYHTVTWATGCQAHAIDKRGIQLRSLADRIRLACIFP